MNKKFAIKINNISKSFDEKHVIKDVSFALYFGEKVGLVGANGSGKSTLAKIISSIEKPSEGKIEIFKNFSVSYLPQEFKEDILVSEYFKNIDSNKSSVLKVLAQFSFPDAILDRKILSLSGGEKTKIFLARIEMGQSDIIILDEPTNNLDTEGIKYLEKVIEKSKSAFLIISHDRKFLDNTVKKVIELNEYTGSIKTYDGNYSEYKISKESYEKRENMLYAENQRKKGKINKEITRNDEKSSRNLKTTVIKTDNNKMAAKKRIELLERSAGKNLKRAQVKLENLEERESTITKRPLKIDFSEMKKSGNDVLKIKSLYLKYGYSKAIDSEVNIADRLLISGKNGAGKTTLIKALLNTCDGMDMLPQSLSESII
jgi:ATP-binding cassette subfamily F protein 3